MKEKLEILKLKGELFIGRIKIFMFILILLLEIFIIGKFVIDQKLINLEPMGEKIALVNFNKQITNEYVNQTILNIEEAFNDKKGYRELLFIMNSPGGSPAASEELSEYLKELNKTVKITMYVQSMAASGGYYIASSIKPLIVNKNAIVGSIGVIMPHYSLEKLARKIGIEEDDLSAGKYKKPISLFNKVTPENKEYLTKQILSPMYENFLESVATNREINISELRPLAEGKIYLGNNPEIKDKLVDEISSIYFVKKKIKDKYNKTNPNIKFININEDKPAGLFGSKLSMDLNLKGLFAEQSNIGEVMK